MRKKVYTIHTCPNCGRNKQKGGEKDSESEGDKKGSGKKAVKKGKPNKKSVSLVQETDEDGEVASEESHFGLVQVEGICLSQSQDLDLRNCVLLDS